MLTPSSTRRAAYSIDCTAARVVRAIDLDELGRAQAPPPQRDLEQLLLAEHPDRRRGQRRVRAPGCRGGSGGSTCRRTRGRAAPARAPARRAARCRAARSRGARTSGCARRRRAAIELAPHDVDERRRGDACHRAEHAHAVEERHRPHLRMGATIGRARRWEMSCRCPDLAMEPRVTLGAMSRVLAVLAACLLLCARAADADTVDTNVSQLERRQDVQGPARRGARALEVPGRARGDRAVDRAHQRQRCDDPARVRARAREDDRRAHAPTTRASSASTRSTQAATIDKDAKVRKTAIAALKALAGLKRKRGDGRDEAAGVRQHRPDRSISRRSCRRTRAIARDERASRPASSARATRRAGPAGCRRPPSCRSSRVARVHRRVDREEDRHHEGGRADADRVHRRDPRRAVERQGRRREVGSEPGRLGERLGEGDDRHRATATSRAACATASRRSPRT